MATDIKTIYLGSLRNTHAAETQGLQSMERQVEGMGRYPEYQALLYRHIEVTRRQLERIERALEDAGGSLSAIKEAVTATVGNVGAAIHAFAQDETLKNLYAGYAYQYEQIAAYRSLKVIARYAGYEQHGVWIDQSIREEEEAAQAAAALIEPVTQQYLELTLRGEKADS